MILDAKQQEDAFKAARKAMQDQQMLSMALSKEETEHRNRENKAFAEAQIQENALAELGGPGSEGDDDDDSSSQEVDEHMEKVPRLVDPLKAKASGKKAVKKEKGDVALAAVKRESGAAPVNKKEPGESLGNKAPSAAKGTKRKAPELDNDSEATERALEASLQELKGVSKRFCAGGYDECKGRTMQSECKSIKLLCEEVGKQSRALIALGWSRSHDKLVKASDLLTTALEIRNFIQAFARDGTLLTLSACWNKVVVFCKPSPAKAEQFLMAYLRSVLEGVSETDSEPLVKAMWLANIGPSNTVLTRTSTRAYTPHSHSHYMHIAHRRAHTHIQCAHTLTLTVPRYVSSSTALWLQSITLPSRPRAPTGSWQRCS